MDQEQKLELGAQIWRLFKAGCDRIQVLQELGISVQQLEDCLREFESQLAVDVGRAMKHYQELDNARVEAVIQALMPIALDAPDSPEEVLAESEADFDLRLKAGYAVLGCIEARQKIFAASQPQQRSVRERSVDVVAWLQQLDTQNGDGNASAE
jgi:hypothetical protein